MKTEIELDPIIEDESDYDLLESEIIKLLQKEIYLPMLSELRIPKSILKNSIGDLIDDIGSGQITYERGRFTGKFSSRISRDLRALGAVWDRKTSSYRIAHALLPVDVKTAIALSLAKFEERLRNIDRRLSQILPEEIAERLKVEEIFDATLWKVDKSFRRSVRNITVAPELTPERRRKIAEEYTFNMKLEIKKWADEEIIRLRQQMQKSAFSGVRYESMIGVIQRSYGVGKNKAKFLARQETGLLMAKFKASRYTDAGVNEYRWGCVVASPKHPVRPMHKALEGKVFRWDTPPVTDIKGSRNNPGEDYNCRCFARPIVKF